MGGCIWGADIVADIGIRHNLGIMDLIEEVIQIVMKLFVISHLILVFSTRRLLYVSSLLVSSAYSGQFVLNCGAKININKGEKNTRVFPSP